MANWGKQATAILKHVDAMILEREDKILTKLAARAIGIAVGEDRKLMVEKRIK